LAQLLGAGKTTSLVKVFHFTLPELNGITVSPILEFLSRIVLETFTMLSGKRVPGALPNY